MTKKSAGRMERDAQKKATEQILKNPESNAMNWNDLEDIFQENSKMLITANSNMANVFRIPGVADNVPDKKGTIDHIRGLAKDIRFFGEELVKIKKDHEGKSGVAKDSDDTITAIKIYEGYVHWQQEYHSVIIPTITFLSEQAGLAVETIEAATKVLDPKVVTDVEIKEPAVEALPSVVDSTDSPSSVV